MAYKLIHTKSASGNSAARSMCAAAALGAVMVLGACKYEPDETIVGGDGTLPPNPIEEYSGRWETDTGVTMEAAIAEDGSFSGTTSEGVEVAGKINWDGGTMQSSGITANITFIDQCHLGVDEYLAFSDELFRTYQVHVNHSPGDSETCP